MCSQTFIGGSCSNYTSGPSDAAFFHTAPSPVDWKAASFLTCASVGACDYLRSPTFNLTITPTQAIMHLATAGWVEVWINGVRAGGNAVLEGSWTQWNVRLPTTAYDVTALLHVGGNAVGLVLGNGWWGHLGHRAAAAAILTVTSPSEKIEIITDPSSWKGSAGPIFADDIYNGEGYNMAMELPGWASPAHNITAWDTTMVPSSEPFLLTAQRSWQAVQPVQARWSDTIAAITVGRPSLTQFVVDFGLNSAGWTRLSLPGGCPVGSVIRLLHSENLFANGTVDRGNLRSAEAVETLMCDGRPDEFVYEPRFTYHGFRYTAVEGWPSSLPLPVPEFFTKVEVHNAVEWTGRSPVNLPSSLEFSPPSSILNSIHSIIERGQLYLQPYLTPYQCIEFLTHNLNLPSFCTGPTFMGELPLIVLNGTSGKAGWLMPV